MTSYVPVKAMAFRWQQQTTKSLKSEKLQLILHTTIKNKEIWFSMKSRLFTKLSSYTKVLTSPAKQDFRLSSKIKVCTDLSMNQYCAHSFQYVLWTLCSLVNGRSAKVPPLYISIFVPLYIESLYSHTVQWTFQLELGNMCGQPILPLSSSKDTITSSNRLLLKTQLCGLLPLIFPCFG